ncbi:succinate dehydrogenase hydrophobic membrane anchor subunit [Pontimonas sp.]|jgi:succinate dehydrogenase / fumarate reductase membrane anchor subunit|uniref:succinate dehydrogenase hydrophobic membrane anchor subunit n=1 Tax=Pontimonas sp. TaxID=2304492 RepID=UPI00286FEDE7|nr:succinate dehydrogenase hydrophobic membrane anchor subunit [Pontimonas sp.]MDR9397097.1 succinate dehydrogenase hydrophobic membrane anchor subunit [Pontimonas sp.]MDR9434845.1 succinate dehydrogenase hydrophobic membrane anchor subunit [Pontimonas sp.]
MSVTIEVPNTPVRPHKRGVNWEKWGWIYMRISGIALIVLIFGHLFVNLMVGDGVKAIDFAFVAGKLTNPFWIVWDTAMLWLALIHGANGMRTIVNDYASRERTRMILHGALVISTLALLILGTLTIYAFDPCPAGSPAELLPSFCGVAG